MHTLHPYVAAESNISLDKQIRIHIIYSYGEDKIKKYIIVCIALIIFLLPSILYAADAAYEKHLAKGILSIETRDYPGAINEFKAAIKENPKNPTAVLYLGIAQSRSGDKEAETTLRKALTMNPSDPRAHLELGIYYFTYSLYDKARDYFEKTVTLAPATEFSAKAEEYLKQIKEAASEKRWTLNASLGGQYDSNVVLNPSGGGPLPQGISHQSDWSAVFFANAKYYLIKEEKMEASAGLTFYQNLHATISDYNITQPVLDLTMAYKILPWLQLRGVFSWEYISVGQEEYGHDYLLAPSLVITEGKGSSTVIDYRYRNYTFKNSDLFFDNSQRSGPDNYIAITQNLQITPSVQARLTYSHDVNATQEDFWHYRGNRGALGLSFVFPYKIFMDLYGEYYVQDYNGKDTQTGANRKDKTFTGSIQATKVLSDIFSVTVGQLYTKDDSNIPAFAYNRAITSLFFNARF